MKTKDLLIEWTKRQLGVDHAFRRRDSQAIKSKSKLSERVPALKQLLSARGHGNIAVKIPDYNENGSQWNQFVENQLKPIKVERQLKRLRLDQALPDT